MLDETRSDHDPSRRLEGAFRAYLERLERGEEPDLPEELLHDPEARAALNELIEDERELERWFGPLRAVTQAAGVGRPFGNYELLEVVAVGGQGVVYRAREVHINKEVALKLVNPRDRPRSLRELEFAGNLDHDHLVRVYHVGEHANRLYFTMKLAEKGSLDKHLEEYALPGVAATTAAERESVEARKRMIAGFMAKIARAVHYIHLQRIIHRDLKPGNILLDAQGEPLVTDFGLAVRVGEDVDASATAGYAPPDQIRGAAQTHAVDIYGLGALLFKLLTTRTPFVGATRSEMVAHTADEEQLAPLPSVYNPNVGTGSDLELICLKCLAKDPKSRYANAAALADDLERCAREEETSVRPQGPLERSLRVLVSAVNHKLSIRGIERWGAIDLWDAGLNLILGVALYLMIRTDRPPALLWLALLSFDLVWWWMFLTFLFRHQPLEPAERHLALLWAGVTVAGLTLFAIYCPPFGAARAADLLAFFPPWAVVNGVGFLIVGRLYWGRYYLVGLAHFLLAVLMPLRLDLAPLVYGAFVAVCMVYNAWDHYRAGWRKQAPEHAHPQTRS